MLYLTTNAEEIKHESSLNIRDVLNILFRVEPERALKYRASRFTVVKVSGTGRAQAFIFKPSQSRAETGLHFKGPGSGLGIRAWYIWF